MLRTVFVYATYRQKNKRHGERKGQKNRQNKRRCVHCARIAKRASVGCSTKEPASQNAV